MGGEYLSVGAELHTWVKYPCWLVSFSADPWTLALCTHIPVEVKDLPSWSTDQQEEPEWSLLVVVALL